MDSLMLSKKSLHIEVRNKNSIWQKAANHFSPQNFSGARRFVARLSIDNYLLIYLISLI